MDIYIENISISEQFTNNSTKFLLENIPKSSKSSKSSEFPHGCPKILTLPNDSISVAIYVIKKTKSVPCVLNFANNEVFGGGYNMKGTTQEEILAKQTTLGATLLSQYFN